MWFDEIAPKCVKKMYFQKKTQEKENWQHC